MWDKLRMGITNQYYISTRSWLVRTKISMSSWTNSAAIDIYVMLIHSNETQLVNFFFFFKNRRFYVEVDFSVIDWFGRNI